MKTVLWLH